MNDVHKYVYQNELFPPSEINKRVFSFPSYIILQLLENKFKYIFDFWNEWFPKFWLTKIYKAK